MDFNQIFEIIILIFSVIIHEISHGFMALSFGDKTAEYEGRLTLNPIKHIDWIGSVILPLLLLVTHAGFIIGWAKPVPYNPYNLRHRKIAEPLVALAGPLSNFLVAIIFGIAIRILISNGMYTSPLILLFGYVVLINISLAIFNLIPIPPLDGSKILFSFMPVRGRFAFSAAAQKYGLILIILIFVILPSIAGLISPVIYSLFSLITGLSL